MLMTRTTISFTRDGMQLIQEAGGGPTRCVYGMAPGITTTTPEKTMAAGSGQFSVLSDPSE